MIADLIPDAEVIARQWALNDSEITALVGSRVATRLPSTPTFPFLTVVRIGGVFAADTEAPIDEALLQWDCYGAKGSEAPDYASASAVARTLIHQAETFNGAIVHTGGNALVYGFENANGPTRLEEPETGWARYVVETVLVMRRN